MSSSLASCIMNVWCNTISQEALTVLIGVEESVPLQGCNNGKLLLGHCFCNYLRKQKERWRQTITELQKTPHLILESSFKEITETLNFSKFNMMVLPNTFKCYFAISKHVWISVTNDLLSPRFPRCKFNCSDIHSLEEFRQLQWNEPGERKH